MVTSQGFNALLKTLEEPPPHAKFIFATTEIRKVPVTVLSRCQRFDLRRVDAAVLVKHLGGIAEKESIKVEPEALALIARASEGSVRDSLSLFDQAIAHAAGAVRAEDVRQMLGLADRARTIDLFEAVMKGDAAAALKELREQYDTGADPAVALADLAEFTHFVTRLKVVPSVADDVSIAEVERTRGRGFAERLSLRVLSRAWQMLLKGISEVEAAGRPLAAAEMVLVRMAYAADLPTPDEVIRLLGGGEGGGQGQGPAQGSVSAQSNGPSARRIDVPRADAPRSDALRMPPRLALAPAAQPAAPSAESQALVVNRFEEVIALAAQKRDLGIKAALERDVRLVRCEDGRLEVKLERSASSTLVNDLARKLSLWTNRRWMVVVSAEEGQPTIKAQNEARQVELKTGVQADPLVRAVLARFPGAEIVGVREAEQPVVLPTGEPEDEPDTGVTGDSPEPPPVDDIMDYGADDDR
jgi:DNA polymerase-3 subunit gamma/tau